ncbi:MAG: DNA repair exonuclease [Desulfovibrio sp.]|jgi:DNA repair exonuclease SbcCD nuclease subunit|nr:DNA repair exonuclease [Desulfovibrio sp.]
MEQTLRYIHAADLHLEAALSALTDSEAKDRCLAEATYTALARLIRYCEAERPDFLVLAGDVYDSENHSVKSQRELRDGCVRLNDLGIPVLIAHGNHDPLGSRLRTLDWPANVTFFGPEVARVSVLRGGHMLAMIHGVSHAKADESRNLATFFSRDEEFDGFQLGVLHCCIQGQTGDRYAPCTLEDLKKTGLDAWALGHVHTRVELCDRPYIAYSGNTQGLHINEQGAKGCNLVTVKRLPDGGFACASKFLPLAPVRWQIINNLDVDGTQTLDEVAERIAGRLAVACTALDDGCQILIVRVRLEGRTVLDGELRKPGGREAVQEMVLRGAQGDCVILKDIEVDTRPQVDMEEYRSRDDLLGIALQDAYVARTDDERRAQVRQALSPIESKSLKQVLPPLDDDQIKDFLGEAERLCLDLLEADDVH